MYFRRTVAYVSYKLNQLSTRERLIILASILMATFFLWDLLLLQTHVEKSKQLKQKFTIANEQVQNLTKETLRIKQQLKQSQTKRLVQKLKEIDEQLTYYKNKAKTYKQKTMSQRKIVYMLNSVFKEANTVKVIGFYNIKTPTLPIVNTSSNSKDKKAKTSKVTANIPNKLVKKYYGLHLQGRYFDIMSYLRKLERLPWQIYWDKMDYQVKKYPLAEIELTFHAMSKDNG